MIFIDIETSQFFGEIIALYSFTVVIELFAFLYTITFIL